MTARQASGNAQASHLCDSAQLTVRSYQRKPPSKRILASAGCGLNSGIFL